MTGQLVVVATPIGNLGDVTTRMTEVLTTAPALYCEDTRRTRVLLSALSIPAGGRLHSLHAHNEASLCDEVVARVERGEIVAVVSDAGTPTVSDPGARVVAAVAAAGLSVTTLPGPSAVVVALAVSGFTADRFVFQGFWPRTAGERRLALEDLAAERRTTVFFEAPTRLAGSLSELAEAFGSRRAVVARELTKMHEELSRGSLADLAREWSGREVRGEIVVVVEGADVREVTAVEVRAAVTAALSSGRSVKDAASDVSTQLGVSRRIAYDAALEISRG